jgi:hypothetical protein
MPESKKEHIMARLLPYVLSACTVGRFIDEYFPSSCQFCGSVAER